MTDANPDGLPVSSPEPTLRHVLRHVNRLFQAELRRRLAAHGVSEAEYVSLFTLRRIPDLSSADLSRWTGVTAQGANQVLQNLIANGLVGRRRSPVHGRILEARLTARGQRVIEACEREADELEAVMCADLSEDETVQLEALLRRCAEGLGTPVTKPVPPPRRVVRGGGRRSR